MFDNKVGLTSENLHFKEAKFGVNNIELIDNGSDCLVFLLSSD